MLKLFESIIPVSDDLKNTLAEKLITEIVPKRAILLREGQVCNNIYFIEKGFIRSFYLKEGKEITSWLMKEGDVITSVSSFFKREPGYEFIQSVEESTVHYLHYNELQNIYKHFIEFNIVGRVLTEKYYTLSEERLYSMRKQSAEERFAFLLDKHPELIMRAPRGYIASYLGISLETLSRIKNKK